MGRSATVMRRHLELLVRCLNSANNGKPLGSLQWLVQAGCSLSIQQFGGLVALRAVIASACFCRSALHLKAAAAG